MTNTITNDPVFQRMIEDLVARNRGPASQKHLLRAYKRFAAWLGRTPDTATADDIRDFQRHLAETKVSASTRNATMSGLRFCPPRWSPFIAAMVPPSRNSSHNVG